MQHPRLSSALMLFLAAFAVAGPAAAQQPAAAPNPALYRTPYMASPPLVQDSPDELKQRIADLTDFPIELDQRLWGPDYRLKPDVAARTIEIVNRLFNGLKLQNKALSIADIELFGSNASYEYDDKADFGVHVFLRTANNPAAYQENVDDLERFMRLFNDKIEQDQDGQVTFRGIPLEIVFHAVRPEGFRNTEGLPQYSIWSADPSRTGRWINPKSPPPVPAQNAFDPATIQARAQDFIDRYNALAIAYFAGKQGFDCSRFSALRKEMKAYRSDEISRFGQRSNGNLTYRLLRRLDINMLEANDDLKLECENIRDSLF